MHRSKYIPLAFIPLWLGAGCGLSILYGGEYMNSGQIAILVAIIGVIGTLVVAYLQLRRDGNTINSIGSDTTNMKPRVENIEKNVEKTKDALIESVKPSLKDIVERNEKIDEIYKEIEYHQRLKQEFSENAFGRDNLLAGINTIYAENARLNQLHHADQEQIIRLINENGKLKEKIENLEASLKQGRLKNQQKSHGRGWTLER